MSPPIDPDGPTADLDWIAFRYLAGELSETDRLAFDERLAIDQDAREALSAAVELAQVIQLTGVTPSRRPAVWPRWALLAAAASIAIAFWMGLDRMPRASAGEVALVWSDLRQPVAPVDELADPPHNDEPIENADDPGDVPGWLFDVLEAPAEPAL